ncbi:MAG: hypothetical protein ACREQZ_10105 [Woeseiaceae bacterium]
MREQHAYINLGKTYPVEFRFSLDSERELVSLLAQVDELERRIIALERALSGLVEREEEYE